MLDGAADAEHPQIAVRRQHEHDGGKPTDRARRLSNLDGPGERSCPPGFQVTCEGSASDDLRDGRYAQRRICSRSASAFSSRDRQPVSSATWRQPCAKVVRGGPREAYSRRLSAHLQRVCARGFRLSLSRMCEPASLVAVSSNTDTLASRLVDAMRIVRNGSRGLCGTRADSPVPAVLFCARRSQRVQTQFSINSSPTDQQLQTALNQIRTYPAVALTSDVGVRSRQHHHLTGYMPNAWRRNASLLRSICARYSSPPNSGPDYPT